MLEHNLRAQQKYNKFTVHGKLQPIVSKLYVKFMNAVQCFKGYKLCDVNTLDLYTARWQPTMYDSSLLHWE